jgi:hypothetical protein
MKRFILFTFSLDVRKKLILSEEWLNPPLINSTLYNSLCMLRSYKNVQFTNDLKLVLFKSSGYCKHIIFSNHAIHTEDENLIFASASAHPTIMSLT